MIDPINVTDYNRTENELQEFIAFGLLVTGKNAITTSRLLDNFIKDFKYEDDTLFEVFKRFELTVLSQALKDYGFGCYNAKAKGIYQLVRANLNLRTCTVDDLEKISGIGKKTSRFFVLHTRQDAQCIPLDVHILHYLRDLGHDVPKATPCNKKYLEIEKICLKYVSSSKKTCAEWDLDTWRTYSGNKVAI
jgi:thermostable 8-oxoguanine DNA glycosylase